MRLMDTNLSIEEALRVVYEKAAVLRSLGGVAAHSNYTSPDAAVLRGTDYMCGHRSPDGPRQRRHWTGHARPPKRGETVSDVELGQETSASVSTSDAGSQ